LQHVELCGRADRITLARQLGSHAACVDLRACGTRLLDVGTNLVPGLEDIVLSAAQRTLRTNLLHASGSMLSFDTGRYPRVETPRQVGLQLIAP